MLLFIYVFVETLYSFLRNFKAINKLRIFIKACLLSLAHFNPIYVISVCTILDISLTILQFYRIQKRNQFTKIFTLAHILSTVAIILMIFVP